MSVENVELVRQIYAAVPSGGAERLFAMLDPELEWDASRRLIDPAIYHGHDGLREVTRQQGAARIWEIRDGRAVRATVHQSKDEALEAVGLQG